MTKYQYVYCNEIADPFKAKYDKQLIFLDIVDRLTYIRKTNVMTKFIVYAYKKHKVGLFEKQTYEELDYDESIHQELQRIANTISSDSRVFTVDTTKTWVPFKDIGNYQIEITFPKDQVYQDWVI